ncbi:MAG: WD40 repeat domain-containing protein, partial [Chloroflexota bacterium]
ENNDITHTLPVTSVSYGRAGNTVISGGEDGLVIVWSTGTGRNMRIFDTHEDAVTGVAFNPEGTSALSSSQDGIVYWWSIESDEVAQSFTGGHAAEILSATYAADGSQLLASSTDENRLVLWDAATGNEIQRFNRNEEHTGQINHAVFTPDGTRFITVAADGTALVWDIASETIVSTFDMTSDGEMLRVAIHPDGTLAATGDENGLLYLWDIETGALVHELSDGTGEVGHRRDILSLAFSPDGTQLLSGSEDRSMILWSVDSGEPLRTYDGQRGRVIAVGFDESGQQLYSATNSDTLFVWDKDNTLPMATYDVSVEGEERTVTAVDFAADGNRALIGRVSGEIVLLNMQTAQPIAVYPDAVNGQINVLAFSPDESAAIAGTRTRDLSEVRTLPLNALIEWTTVNRYIPDLTCADRET